MDGEGFLSTLNDNLMIKPVDELKNEEFSSEVASGKIKFLTVVESLQGILTNENISIREKGIEFLSWLLAQLPKELFNCTENSVLVNFFCDCLKGHHNFLSAAIKGLLELMKMKLIKKEDVVKIVINLFQNVNCQTQLQPDRLALYTILKFVIENHLEDVKEMGPDFVFGVIAFTEGESDPFCLILILSFLPVFIKNFDLGHLNEEMFELLSCYFPVDFNPSAKEHLTITRDDLAEGLHQCLSATSSFSEQSIPVILEKVDSTFKNAKIDSYKLLRECCKNLRIESIEKHINPLWKCLSKDVLPGNDNEVCQFGLLALSDIIHLLSKDESHKMILKDFLDDILTTVRSLINRVDENMFQAGIKVLTAVASRSKPAASRILIHLKTFARLESASTLMEKKTLLSSLLPFLRICQEFKIVDSQDQEEKSSYLELVALYLDEATSDDYETRKLAFSGICEVLPQSFEFRKRLFEILGVNLKTKDDIRISDELFKIWRNLAQSHHQECSDFFRETRKFDSSAHFSNFLWLLSLVEDLPQWTNEMVTYHLEVITTSPDGYVALEAFLNACKLSQTNQSFDFFHTVQSKQMVIQNLITWCQSTSKETKEKCIQLVSEIIAIVVRHQTFQEQQTIVDDTSALIGGLQLNGNGDFDPLTQLSNLDHPENVLMLEAILGSVRQEVTIPMIWILREKLMNLALNSTNDLIRLSAARLLASFVNKSEDSLSLDLLNGISKDVFAYLEDNCELRLKLNSSCLFTWVVKGLVLRGGQSSEECISTWFSLLGRKDVGEAIAEGFRTVIEEDELYLNSKSHCNIRILYRQRLFGNYPKLLKMYEMSDASVKMNYLVALVRLFQGVPIHLIQMEISNIIIILVRCLEADKPEVLTTCLEILTSLLESTEKVFSDYIQSFVPKFLQLSRFDGQMKIRINALKCLFFYGFYPTSTLLPLKNQVIRDLELCLDDKKRLVRKEAVRARCRWFLVGAPGEDILDS